MTDAQQQVSQSEQQIQQQEQTQAQQPVEQQQQQQQTQQQKQQNEYQELAEQVKNTLKKIFMQKTFLGSKYTIPKCINKDLEVCFLHIIENHKFNELNEKITDIFKNPQVFFQLVLSEIQNNEYVKFDTKRYIAKPNFRRERNTIKVGQVSGNQKEEFQKFVEENTDFQFYTEEELEEIKKANSENNVPQQDKNKFRIHVNSNNTLYIIADSEALAEKLFNWLFGRQFKGKELNQLYIQEYDYYYFAYKDIFGKEPTTFKDPLSPRTQEETFYIKQQQKYNQIVFQQQQPMMMNQGQMPQQQINRFHYTKQRNFYNQGPKPFNANNKPNNYQGPKNRTFNNNNNNNNNQQKHHGKGRYNNNNPHKRGNHHKNMNQQQNQPKSKGYEASMDDQQNFPGLG